MEVVVENGEGGLPRLQERLARLHRDEAPTAGGRAYVRSVVSEHLPATLAERQADAAAERLVGSGLPVAPSAEVVAARSLGSVCTVVLEDGQGLRLGGNCLGAAGRRAEDVGWTAAAEALEDRATGATVDRHLADQWVPFVALGSGAVRVPGPTGHLVTNVATCNAFLPRAVRFEAGLLGPGP